MNASQNAGRGFGPIHNAIRFALADLLVAMGRASFRSEAETQRVVADLEEVLAFCASHLDHEDRFVFPRLATRLTGPLDSIVAAHTAQPRMIAELRALGGALLKTDCEKRALVGRTLYLHYSAFVGDALLHMAEEEQFVEPLMLRLFTEEELDEIQENIRGALTPDEITRVTRFVMGSVAEVGG